MNANDNGIGDYVLGTDGLPIEIDGGSTILNSDIIEVLLDAEGEFVEIDSADDLTRAGDIPHLVPREGGHCAPRRSPGGRRVRP